MTIIFFSFLGMLLSCCIHTTSERSHSRVLASLLLAGHRTLKLNPFYRLSAPTLQLSSCTNVTKAFVQKDRVRLVENTFSDFYPQVELKKGTIGVIKKFNGGGHAEIKFCGVAAHTWIRKENLYKLRDAALSVGDRVSALGAFFPESNTSKQIIGEVETIAIDGSALINFVGVSDLVEVAASRLWSLSTMEEVEELALDALFRLEELDSAGIDAVEERKRLSVVVDAYEDFCKQFECPVQEEELVNEQDEFEEDVSSPKQGIDPELLKCETGDDFIRYALKHGAELIKGGNHLHVRMKKNGPKLCICGPSTRSKRLPFNRGRRQRFIDMGICP